MLASADLTVGGQFPGHLGQYFPSHATLVKTPAWVCAGPF